MDFLAGIIAEASCVSGKEEVLTPSTESVTSNTSGVTEEEEEIY